MGAGCCMIIICLWCILTGIVDVGVGVAGYKSLTSVTDKNLEYRATMLLMENTPGIDEGAKFINSLHDAIYYSFIGLIVVGVCRILASVLRLTQTDKKLSVGGECRCTYVIVNVIPLLSLLFGTVFAAIICVLGNSPIAGGLAVLNFVDFFTHICMLCSAKARIEPVNQTFIISTMPTIMGPPVPTTSPNVPYSPLV